MSVGSGSRLELRYDTVDRIAGYRLARADAATSSREVAASSISLAVSFG
jgi:hypothetical protein